MELKTRIGQKKNKGWAWIGGIFIILLIVVMFAFVYQRYRWLYAEQDIEDTITSSALGSLIHDEHRYAITRDVTLRSADESYGILCDLMADNFGLTKVEDCEYTGEHPYFATDAGNCKITEAVFYDVFDSRTETDIYTYKDIGGGKYSKNVTTKATADVETPNGLDVERTSAYVVFEFPIKIVGINFTVHKGTYVTLEYNYDETTDVTAPEEEYTTSVVIHYGNYQKTVTMPVSYSDYRYAEDYIDKNIPAEALAADADLVGYHFVGWVAADHLSAINKTSDGFMARLLDESFRDNRTFLGDRNRTIHIYAVMEKDITFTVGFNQGYMMKLKPVGYTNGYTMDTRMYRVANNYYPFIVTYQGADFYQWKSPWVDVPNCGWTAVGYTFSHWKVQETGEIYYPNDVYYFSPTRYSVTFEAIWTANKYYITVVDPGQYPSPTQTYEYTVEYPTFYIDAPAKSCYNWVKWSGSGFDGTSTRITINPGVETESISGLVYNEAHNNKTVYKNYTPQTYTITYNLNGGNDSGSPVRGATTYNVEYSAFNIPAPTRADYIFTGWTASNGWSFGAGNLSVSPSPYATSVGTNSITNAHHTFSLTANWMPAYTMGTFTGYATTHDHTWELWVRVDNVKIHPSQQITVTFYNVNSNYGYSVTSITGYGSTKGNGGTWSGISINNDNLYFSSNNDGSHMTNPYWITGYWIITIGAPSL